MVRKLYSHLIKVDTARTNAINNVLRNLVGDVIEVEVNLVRVLRGARHAFLKTLRAGLKLNH